MKELNNLDIFCVSGGFTIGNRTITTDSTGIPADMFAAIEQNWGDLMNDNITEGTYIQNMYTSGAYQYVDQWFANPFTVTTTYS